MVLLTELACRYPNLKIFSKENGGPAAARKFGIEKSESDYLAFCDSDDYVEPDWLLTMYEYLIKFDADISIIGAYLNDKNLDVKYDKPYNVWEWDREQSIINFLEHVHLNGILWTNLFKRSLFNDIEWNTSMKLYEDGFLVWQILGKINKIVKVRVPKYHYMFNSQSLTNQEYTFDRYNSYRIFIGKIVSDCSHGDMQKYNHEAKLMQCKWTYRDLYAMTMSAYKNKDAEKSMLSILRDNIKITLFQTTGVRNKLIALFMILNPSIVRGLYKLLK